MVHLKKYDSIIDGVYYINPMYSFPPCYSYFMNILLLMARYGVPIKIKNVRIDKTSPEAMSKIAMYPLGFDDCRIYDELLSNNNINGKCDFVIADYYNTNLPLEELKSGALESITTASKNIKLPFGSFVTKDQLKLYNNFRKSHRDIPNMCVFYIWENTLNFGCIADRKEICSNKGVLIKNLAANFTINGDTEVHHFINGDNIFFYETDFSIKNFYNDFRKCKTDNQKSISTTINKEFICELENVLGWASWKCPDLRNKSIIERQIQLLKKLESQLVTCKYFKSYKETTEEIVDCFYCDIIDKNGKSYVLPIYMVNWTGIYLIENDLGAIKEHFGSW